MFFEIEDWPLTLSSLSQRMLTFPYFLTPNFTSIPLSSSFHSHHFPYFPSHHSPTLPYFPYFPTLHFPPRISPAFQFPISPSSSFPLLLPFSTLQPSLPPSLHQLLPYLLSSLLISIYIRLFPYYPTPNFSSLNLPLSFSLRTLSLDPPMPLPSFPYHFPYFPSFRSPHFSYFSCPHVPSLMLHSPFLPLSKFSLLVNLSLS